MKAKKTSFEHKGLVAIALVFALIAVILFFERSGIQYRYNKLSLELMPAQQIVSKEEAMSKQAKDCLVIWNNEDANSSMAWEQFEIILADMKIGYDLVDVHDTDSYPFEGHKTAIVLLSNLSVMGEELLTMSDWVEAGGAVLFPLTLEKESHFTVIEAKLGISDSSYSNAMVDSIYVNEDFMIGGGRSFEIMDPWDSALTVQLMDDARVTVHAYTDDERRIPLIWEAQYGKGKFVVDNFGLCTKGMRGFFSASYSLLEDVCVYPVINGSVFYLDDFPSQIPSGNSSYIQRDYGTTIRDFYVNIWWPEMMNFADRYGIKFTGLAIECYDDAVDGTTDAKPDEGTFLNFGNMLLRMGGEIGYHGYNHQPLCFDNCDYKGIYDYKTWQSYEAMKSAMDELMDFCESLFPGVSMQIYVPPSNLLSDEGREFLLKEYPHIETISGIYFEEDELDFSCMQEYDVSETGVVDQPRIISGCYINPFMELAAISELNYHYINNHFTHPDDALDPDRGAEMGWEKLSDHFDTYLSWLYTSAPNLRNFTGSEMSAAVQRYVALSPKTEMSGNQIQITLGGFYDEAQLMVRINDGEPKEVVGGTLEKLTDTLYLLQASEPTVTLTLE